jgi:uncharacterized protein YjbI with pentapeptide repeats
VPPTTARIFTEGEKGLLAGQVFRGVDLDGSDFRGADLRSAWFHDVSLRGCDFTAADLRGARFLRCDVRGACFAQARFDRNRFDGSSFLGSRGVSTSISAYIRRCGGLILDAANGKRKATRGE